MDRESVERLRFDRRLHSRRGWLEETDLAEHIESLEDVSSKMTTAAELEAEEAAAADAAESAEAAQARPSAGQAPAGHSAVPASSESIGVGPSSGLAGDFSSGRSELGGGGFGGGSNGSSDS